MIIAKAPRSLVNEIAFAVPSREPGYHEQLSQGKYSYFFQKLKLIIDVDELRNVTDILKWVNLSLLLLPGIYYVIKCSNWEERIVKQKIISKR